MQNNVRFTCTVLAGTKKQGILPKDEFGYRTMPIGGLNCFNSMGEYYTYEGAKALFEQSSSFMRRVTSSCLKSEMGHPKPLPGQSEDSFCSRVMTIDEKNVAAHIQSVELDFTNFKDDSGKPIIAIMGKVKPAGPHMLAMEASFDNPKEEVCFSVRAFTDDKRVAGINQRSLVEIVTFDVVTEPGIKMARKYHSPSLEQLQEARFSQAAMVRAATPIPGVAMESNSFSTATLFKSLGWTYDSKQEPPYLKW